MLTTTIDSKVTKKTLVLLVAVLITASSFAQRTHELRFNWRQVTLRDEWLGGENLTGNGQAFSWIFSQTGHRRKTSLQVEFNQANLLATKDGRIKQNGLLVQLSDGFRVFKQSRRFVQYAGYSIGTQTSVQLVKPRHVHSFHTLSTLAYYHAGSYSWGNQSLGFDMHMPLIGILSRPGEDFRKGEQQAFNGILYSLYADPSFVSLHNNRSVDVTVAYKTKISDRWSAGVHSYYRFMKAEADKDVRQQEFAVGISILYRQ